METSPIRGVSRYEKLTHKVEWLNQDKSTPYIFAIEYGFYPLQSLSIQRGVHKIMLTGMISLIFKETIRPLDIHQGLPAIKQG